MRGSGVLPDMVILQGQLKKYLKRNSKNLYHGYNRQLRISVLLFDIERDKRSKNSASGKEKT